MFCFFNCGFNVEFALIPQSGQWIHTHIQTVRECKIVLDDSLTWGTSTTKVCVCVLVFFIICDVELIIEKQRTVFCGNSRAGRRPHWRKHDEFLQKNEREIQK